MVQVYDGVEVDSLDIGVLNHISHLVFVSEEMLILVMIRSTRT